MNVKLSLYGSTVSHQELNGSDFPIVVGRGSDADITLSDRWVSRHHCELVIRDGVLVVRDLGSKHGTLVDDVSKQEAELMPGVRLSVGLSSIVVDYALPERHGDPNSSPHLDAV